MVGSGPHLLTTEILQTLLAARDRPPQNRYPKLRDPEPFEGEKAKFKTFLAQCELKFRTEGNQFDDDEKKTGYASTLLRGVAWNWVETFLNQEGGINLTWEEVKTNMKHAFGQVDAKEIAFEKFQKIQQGNRTAAPIGRNSSESKQISHMQTMYASLDFEMDYTQK